MIKYVKDIETIYELILKFETKLKPPLSQRNINLKDYAKKIYDNGYLVAVNEEDEYHGIVCFYANDNKTKIAYLTLIAIDERYRGKGYGQTLVCFMEKETVNLGMKGIQLEVHKENKRAIKFYRRLGYIIEGDKNRDSYYMYKEFER